MKKHLLLLLALSIGFVFTGCNNEDSENTEPVYEGVFITHEGNFQGANGSISLYDEEEQSIQHLLFKNVNERDISATIQSMYFDNQKKTGFIVCNAADKVEIIDSETFQSKTAPVEDLVNPRYIAVSGDFGYVTCWGAFGENYTLPDSYLAKVNLNTYSISKKTDIGGGAEGIHIVNNKAYVACYKENEVQVYDLSTDEVVAEIALTGSPYRVLEDKNGSIWVSVSGVGLVKLNTVTNQVETTVDYANIDYSGKVSLNEDKSKIYIVGSGDNSTSEIQVLDVDVETLATTPIITGERFYGVGCNPETGVIYVADHNNYAGNGKVMVYSKQGVKIEEHEVGVLPSSFVFN